MGVTMTEDRYSNLLAIAYRALIESGASDSEIGELGEYWGAGLGVLPRIRGILSTLEKWRDGNEDAASVVERLWRCQFGNGGEV